MKLLKMFGLAAIAALMMAIAGAGSAMAESTALCDSDPGGACAASHLISHVHESTLAGSQAKLLSQILNVECDVLFLGDVETASLLGTSLEINGVFAYENCNNNCEVYEESTPSTINVLKGGHETGTVTGEGRVHVECGFFIDCIYNSVGLSGTFKGPLLSTETNGEASISEQTMNKVGGFGCPSTTKLDIVTTPLIETYLEGGPVLEMACIEVDEGFFLKSSKNGECDKEDSKRLGQFELVWVTPGTALNAHVCAYAERKGYFLDPSCNVKDKKKGREV